MGGIMREYLVCALVVSVFVLAAWFPNYVRNTSIYQGAQSVINIETATIENVDFGSYETATSSAGVTITPAGSFVVLDSTGGAITMTATPVFSTTSVNTGHYMIVTSTDQIVTISSATYATALIRTPDLITQIGPGTMNTFIFDGTYWLHVSSSNFEFVY
jgi:hypothetical protein